MYEELKKAAECATQGEWQVIETEFPCRIGSPHIERRIFTVKDHPQLKGPYPVVNGSVALGTEEFPVYHIVSISEQDAAFIAAANPSAVLALVAENEANKERADAEQESFDRQRRVLDSVKAERDQLKAENEALKKDAGRYRWLRDKSEAVHKFYLSVPIWFSGVKFRKEDVDRTIDDTMNMDASQ